MKRTLIIALFLMGFAYGQENENTAKENSSTMEYFNDVRTDTKKSYRYGQKRVITIAFLDTIGQKIAQDARNFLKLQKKTTALKKQQNTLNSQIKNLKSRLGIITVMGKEMSGQTFVIISFVVLFLLLVFLVFVILRAKNDAAVVTAARKSLLECEESYKLLQRKSMKEKEDLARKLQDEILKNKK